jgi:hypothetical protein
MLEAGLEGTMCRRYSVAIWLVALSSIGVAQTAPTGPYKVLKSIKAGGEGGFDFVYADVVNRRLYIPRGGPPPYVAVFNLDSLAPAADIPSPAARGAAVDPTSGHGFSSSKPVVMWDTKTLKEIKRIDVQGNPDVIMFDPFNDRVWVFSHATPNATLINAVNGTIVGTLDLGGQPEQAVTDGKGHIYVDLEDTNQVAAVDAKTLKVTAHYDLGGKCGAPTGLAFDVKNHILFAACSEPPALVILNADDGKVITSLPIGRGVDGVVFNPATMEAFSSQSDGTLTVVKENSPTSFVVEQTIKTMPSAKTLTLDTKTNQILLIGAEFGPPPEQPPGGGRGRGRGRGPVIPASFSILVVGKS